MSIVKYMKTEACKRGTDESDLQRCGQRLKENKGRRYLPLSPPYPFPLTRTGLARVSGAASRRLEGARERDQLWAPRETCSCRKGPPSGIVTLGGGTQTPLTKYINL